MTKETVKQLFDLAALLIAILMLEATVLVSIVVFGLDSIERKIIFWAELFILLVPYNLTRMYFKRRI